MSNIYLFVFVTGTTFCPSVPLQVWSPCCPLGPNKRLIASGEEDWGTNKWEDYGIGGREVWKCVKGGLLCFGRAFIISSVNVSWNSWSVKACMVFSCFCFVPIKDCLLMYLVIFYYKELGSPIWPKYYITIWVILFHILFIYIVISEWNKVFTILVGQINQNKNAKEIINALSVSGTVSLYNSSIQAEV